MYSSARDTQAQGAGYLSAAASAALDVSALLRRLDSLTADAAAVRNALVLQSRPADNFDGALSNQRGFAALPPLVAQQIFILLSPDQRARSQLVCRAWRDAIADPHVWKRLDMSSIYGGFERRFCRLAVLRGASARARGQLEAIVLRSYNDVDLADLCYVLKANGGTLRELTFIKGNDTWTAARLQHMLRVAPKLHVFYAELTSVSLGKAVQLLRNDPPFGALRLRRLDVADPKLPRHFNGADVLSLVTSVSQHASLQDLSLASPHYDFDVCVLDALAEVVSAHRLQSLQLSGRLMMPESLPALVRMLRSGVFKSLALRHQTSNDFDTQPMFVGTTAVRFAGLIAAHRTLRRLELCNVGLWCSAPAAAALMRAVTGHPSLQSLDLSSNDLVPHARSGKPYDPEEAAIALGQVLAANTPSLHRLSVHSSNLKEAGMRPLLIALAHNTHLRELTCHSNGLTSVDFVRDVFEPAVLANTSLCKLTIDGLGNPVADTAEYELRRVQREFDYRRLQRRRSESSASYF